MLKFLALAALLAAAASARRRTTGQSFLFAIPHIHHDISGDSPSNHVTLVNDDSTQIASVIIQYDRLQNPNEVQLDPLSITRIDIPYIQGDEIRLESVVFTPDIVHVTADSDITVIFEQYFGANNSQQKATLVLPTDALGTSYTVPTGGPTDNGPMLISPMMPGDDTNVTIESRTDGEKISSLMQFNSLSPTLALQNQLSGFDGATVTSDGNPIAVQAVGSRNRMTMLLPDEQLGRSYALGVGRYTVYASGADPVSVISGGVIPLEITPGEPFPLEIAESQGGTTLNVMGTGRILVLFNTDDDWTMVPEVNQYIRATETRFTSLQSNVQNVRIIADRGLVGQMRLNSVQIETRQWIRIGMLNGDEYFYADMTTDEDMNILSVISGTGKYNVIVFSDNAAYVPALALVP